MAILKKGRFHCVLSRVSMSEQVMTGENLAEDTERRE